MDSPYTNPKIIFIVVVSLAVFTFIGLIGTIAMCFMKVDGSSIGIVSGFTGTSLGYLASLLSSTKAHQSKPLPEPKAPAEKVL